MEENKVEETIKPTEPILSKEEKGLLRAKLARKIRSYIMTFFGLVVLIIFIYAFLFME